MANRLEAGFARLDATPMLGIGLSGYYVERHAAGILDPLEVNALALRAGQDACVLVSVDNCGLAPTKVFDRCRERAAEAAGLPADHVFIAATHTHTSPFWGEGEDEQVLSYTRFLETRIADAARLAMEDLRPARMGTAVGRAPDVAFVRRFRMKDGSIRTNPGVNNPQIDCPIGQVDERVGVVRFRREGGGDLVLVNFGNHPDVVGGSSISADWPGFLRRRLEAALEGVKCVFFNGAQGDVNHVNVHPTAGFRNDLHPDFDDVDRGYGHARHIGNVVAGAVLQVYDKTEWHDTGRIAVRRRMITVPSNLPDPAKLEDARRYALLHRAGRDAEIPFEGMQLTTVVAEAERMLRLEHGPDSFEMPLTAAAIGQTALIGLPGEPFTGIGLALKAAPGWDLVLPCCIANGYEGYFPMKEAYDEGGYEARSSVFASGVAERIIKESLELLASLRGEGEL
ncbi:MAG: hypothetical protein IKE30_04865 [Clostridia bacterium]|nr:hypothetical protein [Clostridia bacterium]